LGLGGGLGKEHSLVGKNWGCNRVEVELRRREQKEEEWR